MALSGTHGALSGELGKRTLRKVRRRVLQLMVWLYPVAFLDRNNVVCVKITMSEDVGLSATAYGLGRSLLHRLRHLRSEQRRDAPVERPEVNHLGIFATAMDAVTGETSIYIIRFLLGAAEAGFVPAVILSMTYWFPAAKRVAVLGVFILAQPLANALGAPVLGAAADDGRHLGSPGLAVDVPHRGPAGEHYAVGWGTPRWLL